MIQFGIGDAMLHYPALIQRLTPAEERLLDALPPNFVAAHLFGSAPEKCPPRPLFLLNWLSHFKIRAVLLGNELDNQSFSTHIPLPQDAGLHVHLEALRRADKFIGSLSCFNCAAQVWQKPSFVLANRSLKEPFIYGRMAINPRCVVRAWNADTPLEVIYREAGEWASRP